MGESHRAEDSVSEDDRAEDRVADERARRVEDAVAATRFGPIEWVRVTGSTNDDLLTAARGGAEPGRVRVADHQTNGRGRSGRVWDDVAGDSLLVSVLLRFDSESTAASVATTVVAVGAAEAIRSLGFEGVSIKWPNDLVVGAAGDQRKLAGVLAQAERDRDGVAVVVGFGCNVAGERLATPGAIALSAIGNPPGRAELLTAILLRIDHWLDQIAAGRSDELRRRWSELSSTLGSRVSVDLGDRVVEGTATAVTDVGALLVATATGETVEVVVGDVVSLRPA